MNFWQELTNHRVVKGAPKLILEAIFEADFSPNSYGFRPKRSQRRALAEVRRSLLRRMSTVVDVDLSCYFDTIRHWVLLEKIARRVEDPNVLHLVKQIVRAGGKIGVRMIVRRRRTKRFLCKRTDCA